MGVRSKVVIYTDLLNDEFSTMEIKTKEVDENYKYKRNGFLRFLCYRVVATPIAWLYCKIKFHQKIIGKEILKKYRKVGYFIYGNHTQIVGDPFIPNNLDVKKVSHIIVHANNISIPKLGRFTPYLGALPIPTKINGFKNFQNAIKDCIDKKRAVVVYPEAHIWPYYTKIRPFGDTSFAYPVKYDTPVFCFTNTYQRRRKTNKVNITTYIDGPFMVDKSLSQNEAKKKLRDEVYNRMCERAKNSNYEYYKYVEGEK